jgi:hypothetical protein
VNLSRKAAMERHMARNGDGEGSENGQPDLATAERFDSRGDRGERPAGRGDRPRFGDRNRERPPRRR